MACPKLSHTHFVSGFWLKYCPFASRWQTHRPPPCNQCTPTTSKHHPTPLLHGVPKTKQHMLGFRFLAHIPPSGFASANAQPPCRLHAINMHPLPTSATPHCHFTWYIQNQTMSTWFQVFGSNQ